MGYSCTHGGCFTSYGLQQIVLGHNGGASMNVTDWGVVEVVPGTRKHMKLEGKEWALTATPLAMAISRS
jgi:hypothetical protein